MGNAMFLYPLTLKQKSWLYASKILIGSALSWGLLHLAGIQNPIWAIITVVLVSDPDITTARTLVTARVINTIVGCTVGLSALTLFGYTLQVALVTVAIMVLLITSIDRYPVNWRLAPVTVLILLDAGRSAATPHQEIHYALLRAAEIGAGSAVAMAMALLYTRLIPAARPPFVGPGK